MQLITKKQAILATLLCVFLHAGFTLLSVYKQQDDYLSGVSFFLWVVPLGIGVVLGVYLTVVKRFRATLFYGIPTVVFAAVVSVVAPSTLTRLITLGLFSLLLLAIWYQHFKAQRLT